MYIYSAFFFSLFGPLATAHPSSSPFSKRTLTPDNTCGDIASGNNNGYTCDPNAANGGPCCSANGYCGTTSAYCGTGCQPAFGTCGTSTTNPGAPVQSGCVWVVNGVGSFTHQQTFDFSQLSSFPTTGLSISTDTIGAGSSPYSQLYTKANVQVTGGSLQLKVPGGQSASPILGAEVYTTDNDILYGSVRTTMEVSSVAGTCHGAFFYKADNQETDIEILTGNLASGQHDTNQNVVLGGQSTTSTNPLPSDATTAFHEYRLDWLSDRTEFYLDGVLQQTLTANVPSEAGTWLWNNWSNGDQAWSAGPPAQDDILKIGKIDMYYNRTGSAGTC